VSTAPLSRQPVKEKVRNSFKRPQVEERAQITASTLNTTNTLKRPRQASVSVPEVPVASIESGTAQQIAPAHTLPSITLSTEPPEGQHDTETKATKRKPRRKRSKTPEDGETVEISVTEVRMVDLCRDTRTGKKSSRYKKLKEAESQTKLDKKLGRAVKKNRIQASQEPTEGQDRTEHNGRGPASIVMEPLAPSGTQSSAPQMRLVNGQLVVDDLSLQVDRHANAAVTHQTMEVVEENELTRKVNSGTYRVRKNAGRSWGKDLTDAFYEALRTFGTDFTMIGLKLGRDRRECRMKFNKEERVDPQRVNSALLGERLPINLESMPDIYDDPKLLQAELDRETAEHERQMAAAEAEQEQKRVEAEAAAIRAAEISRKQRLDGDDDDGEEDLEEVQAPGPVTRKTRKPIRGKKKMGGKNKPTKSEVEIVGSIEEVQRQRAAAAAAAG
jgi:transcription factor TFIIIB component B''